MSVPPPMPPMMPPMIPPVTPPPGGPLAYATPQGAYVTQPAYFQADRLVVPARCDLGPQCIKCAEPGTRQWTKKFFWLPSAFALLILVGGIGLIILLVIYFVMRKPATITYSLCELHAGRRRNGLLAGWLLGLGGLLSCLGGLIHLGSLRGSDDSTVALIFIFAMLASAITGLVFGMTWGRPILPRRVDAWTAWLSGVNASTFDPSAVRPIDSPGDPRGFAVTPAP